jgi:tRNA threonylcarbamoyladenosine modification (KEOPS) complex  Pcc1 subunit
LLRLAAAVWATSRVVVPVPDERSLGVVLDALGPEVRVRVTPRSRVSLAERDGAILLVVRAKDTVALRASVNSYLRWIGAVLRVLRVLGGFS